MEEAKKETEEVRRTLADETLAKEKAQAEIEAEKKRGEQLVAKMEDLRTKSDDLKKKATIKNQVTTLESMQLTYSDPQKIIVLGNMLQHNHNVKSDETVVIGSPLTKVSIFLSLSPFAFHFSTFTIGHSSHVFISSFSFNLHPSLLLQRLCLPCQGSHSRTQEVLPFDYLLFHI